MRLIHARTYALESYFNVSVPSYAILSHTWESEEVTFQDMRDLEAAKRKRGFKKIRFACEQAIQDDLQYVWVDTCCIDKSSSAELQEAINSMFKWYADSVICYAYLADVLSSCPLLQGSRRHRRQMGQEWPPHLARIMSRTPKKAPDNQDEDWEESADFWKSAFSRSNWFTRGWTLQELIAPLEVKFYGVNWNYISAKSRLESIISRATKISVNILRSRSQLPFASVAQKIAWAAGRKTTRVEDRAYSLLGILGVHMPLLYGEGENAFKRLQEEVIRASTDLSLFAWITVSDPDTHRRLFARSPDDFEGAQDIVTFGRPDVVQVTHRGVTISCPLIAPVGKVCHLAVLDCRREDEHDRFLALRVRRYPWSHEYHVDASQPGELPSRTRKVSIDFVLDTPSTTIHVTRGFAPGNVTFIVETHLYKARPSNILFGWPPQSWTVSDPSTATLRMVQSDNVKAGIAIQYFFQTFFLVFGADFNNSGVLEPTELPEIMVVASDSDEYGDELLQLCNSWEPGSSSPVDSRSLSDDKSRSFTSHPDSRRCVDVYDRHGRAFAKASIRLLHIFGEFMFKIDFNPYAP